MNVKFDSAKVIENLAPFCINRKLITDISQIAVSDPFVPDADPTCIEIRVELTPPAPSARMALYCRISASDLARSIDPLGMITAELASGINEHWPLPAAPARSAQAVYDHGLSPLDKAIEEVAPRADFVGSLKRLLVVHSI